VALAAAAMAGALAAGATAGRPASAAACRPTAQPGNPPVAFLPGAIRPLAHETLPSSGWSYRIRGERYRFEGCVYFDLSLEIQQPGLPLPLSGGGSDFTPGQTPGALSYSDHQLCQGRGDTIVFGLLRATRDRVLVRSSDGVAPARVVAIPAALHAGGALAYAALPGVLTEVRVTAGTRTVLDDRLPGSGPCRPGSLLIGPQSSTG
jgi:hypothetical protein